MNKKPTNEKRRLYKRNYTFKKRFLNLLFNNNVVRLICFKVNNIFLDEKTKQKYIKNTAKLNDIKEYILICKTTYKREHNEYILIAENKQIKKCFKGIYFDYAENISAYGIKTNRHFNQWKKSIFNYALNSKHASKYKFKTKIIYSRNTTE